MSELSAAERLLHGAWQQGALRDLDFHLARQFAALAPAPSAALMLATALVSQRLGAGDACADLRVVAGRALWPDAPPAPALEDWRAALLDSGLVARAEEADAAARPLILDGADRLYLARYFVYERAVAEALRARAAAWRPVAESAALRASLERLFPAARETPDWQRVAAAVAALRPLTVIAGGPGTGKTTTATAILALLAEHAPRRLRMAMAAPTGKAAARLAEAVRAARARLDCPAPALAQIPEVALTLHRLLGLTGGGRPARYHAGNPLHLDVLVVDEASMIDLPLMARLLAALPPEARLVLLGDKDQLASVEAGVVLADVWQGAGEAVSEPLAAALGEVGCPVPGAADAPALRDSLVLLRTSHRFTGASRVGRAAAAVQQGDAAAVSAALLDAPPPELAALAVEGYRAYLRAALPAEALDAFARFRVLCAVREGPRGLHALNETVRAALGGAGLLRGTGLWYAGRPVMITRNDYDQGLFNGDIGVTWSEPDGHLRVYFPADRGVRGVLPARLPPHETAYAMTVHKSQGSEFDRVALVLPDQDGPLLTRELLYTAITRAREHIDVYAPPQLLEAAVARHTRRASGLAQRLWGPAARA
ncbi:exodeoxyribonuclease V subunit alpha [Ectothiorhodospiraceae bacterium 2226]|nr:exodeoxyribonuclease V subunit alpha [Ectothiorhodospiraceae bacterium 2226]